MAEAKLPPRPRHLPLLPHAQPAAPTPTLANETRACDQVQPRYAVWEITLACDLACRHCGSRAGRARPDELSTAEALDLIDQMSELGVRELTLIGGEAYLRADWLQLIAHATARGLLVGMTTGGQHFDRAKAKAARQAGLSGVSVSIDGLRASHDAQRGREGSHARALAALAAARAEGLRVCANSQFNQCNLHEIEALYALLVAHHVSAWQVQITTAMGRAGDEESLLLQPWQMLDLLPRLAAISARCAADGLTLWPGNNIGYFGPHESQLRARFFGQQRGSCQAGRDVLGIEANGDIKGCPSLPSADYVGGNVRDASLRDLWQRSKPLQFTRTFEKSNLQGYCRECYYAADCRGGCNWTAHVLLGHRGDNPYCHHRALSLWQRGEREVIERRAMATGQPFDYGRFAIRRERWPANEARALAARIGLPLPQELAAR